MDIKVRLRCLGLSTREIDVALLRGEEGLSIADIAHRLKIKESTVKFHLVRVHKKLLIGASKFGGRVHCKLVLALKRVKDLDL